MAFLSTTHRYSVHCERRVTKTENIHILEAQIVLFCFCFFQKMTQITKQLATYWLL